MTVDQLEVPRFSLVEGESVGVIVTLFYTRFWQRLQAIACYLSHVGLNGVSVSPGFPSAGEVSVLPRPASYREWWPSFHERITNMHPPFFSSGDAIFKKLGSVPRLPGSSYRVERLEE